jgi:16S rRNA U516 pseudouridylate synthase RsuA-like enzyme
LIRVRIGQFYVAEIPPATWRQLTKDERALLFE